MSRQDFIPTHNNIEARKITRSDDNVRLDMLSSGLPCRSFEQFYHFRTFKKKSFIDWRVHTKSGNIPHSDPNPPIDCNLTKGDEKRRQHWRRQDNSTKDQEMLSWCTTPTIFLQLTIKFLPLVAKYVLWATATGCKNNQTNSNPVEKKITSGLGKSTIGESLRWILTD